MARKYEMKRRAERQQETRRKIVEAAVELHQTVGPAQASISAIAERAGVQRHTFYRHFPDMESLFGACRERYLTLNPPPEVERWREIADPVERLRHGLGEAYAFYDRNEPMIFNTLRDAQAGLPVGAGFVRLREVMTDALASGRKARGRRRRMLLAALGVALDFHVWRSLVRERGLSQEEAVALMVGLVEAGPGGTCSRGSATRP
jgi:AcrR family transcriptional regulator